MKFYAVLLSLCLALFMCGCIEPPPLVDGGSIQINGDDVYWAPNEFPLWVFIDATMDEAHIDATIIACDTWNDTIGEQVFEVVLWDFERPLPRTRGVVAVSIRQLGHSPGGNVVNGLHRGSYHPGTRHRVSSMVWFDEDLADDHLEVVMLHEMGHALTLDHDPGNPRSVMHPQVSVMPQPVYVMPEDIDRIRHMVRGETVYNTSPVTSSPTTIILPGGLVI